MNEFHYEADVETLESADPEGEVGEEFGGDEFEGEFEMNESDEMDPPLTEMDEMEFATELLDVTNEAELGRVLSGLFGRIARRGQRRGRRGNWRRLLRDSPLVQNLKTSLKSVIRQTQAAAPRAASDPGVPPVPPVQPEPRLADGRGGDDAPTAEEILGLELEGLSPEDRDFEIARQIVRLAEEAATQAANAPAEEDPAMAARSAVAAAARRYAPGLLREPSGRPGRGRQGRCDGHHPCSCKGCAGKSGRWVRRGRNVVLKL